MKRRRPILERIQVLVLIGILAGALGGFATGVIAGKGSSSAGAGTR